MTVRQRKNEVVPRAYLVKEDVYFVLELPVLWTISWLAPERAWRSCCYWLERVKWRLGFFSTRAVSEAVGRVLPAHSLKDGGASFALRHAASRSEHHLQIFRTYRPGGWNPDLVLEGGEHLRHALQQGKGAVLWVAHFSFNALAAKKALAENGFGVAHLSRPEHGFSKSGFGIRWLNPIRVNAELLYLSDRIIIERSVPGGAKRAAETLLRQNGIVTITAGAWEGRSVASAKLLGGQIELATGAPSLADNCGAALLPVMTVRDDVSGRIRVIIEPPVAGKPGRDLPQRLAEMTQEFVSRMEPYVLAYPEQWRDWKSLNFSSDAVGSGGANK
jgi:lauroyl/myristoyl acyltransferase